MYFNDDDNNNGSFFQPPTLLMNQARYGISLSSMELMWPALRFSRSYFYPKFYSTYSVPHGRVKLDAEKRTLTLPDSNLGSLV